MSIELLKGLTLASVKVTDDKEQIRFETDDGRRFMMWHSQDCCETVEVEEVIGDLGDLVGAPILEAEEASNQDDTGGFESATWTFYKLGTIKGHVTLRWLGTSNGYYSEGVDFREVQHDESWWPPAW